MVKKDLAECGGDATFVAAVPHPLDNPVQKPPRVQARVEVSAVLPLAHTKTVAPHDEPGAFAGPQGVPVYAHNPGDRPAIGFHIGR